MASGSLVMHSLKAGGQGGDAPHTPREASLIAERLARRHRENFSVLSRLLPRRYRADFAAVYAFCRWADDLADEAGDRQRSLELLSWWRSELRACFAGHPGGPGHPGHPVFVALLPVVRRRGLSIEPFEQLLDAFVQDQHVHRYETMAQLHAYCRGSADPVGRLVLRIVGCEDERAIGYSDATCTALQLVNHWQDARRDLLERNRIYIPAEVAQRHGLSLEQWASVLRLEAGMSDARGCASCVALGPGCRAVLPAYRETMRELCRSTAELFEQGRRLWPMLPADVRRPIMLFTLGGEAILRKIVRQGFDTMTRRPRIGAAHQGWLTARAWVNLPPRPVVVRTHVAARGIA